MIHDPLVEVTCDGNHCSASILVEPEYKFIGGSGFYDTENSAIENGAQQQFDWIVDGERQYCPDCAP